MLSDCTVLCLNGGSSSLKFAIYRMQGAAELRLAEGAAEGIGLPAGRFWMSDSRGERVMDERSDFSRPAAAVAAVLASLAQHGFHKFSAAGHRIVHGGDRYTAPQMVTSQLALDLKRLIPFAPLHLPSQLELIDTIALDFAGLPQAVCFDTAFHRSIPEVARRFPLPRSLWDEGIRRYGFHGLSFEFVVASLAAAAGRRMIVAHLGSGASMAAVLNGVPVDTTMGLTPASGMMMGTRSGDLDPGVLLYLMKEKQYEPAALERMVDRESGLLGVSGLSSDMKTLLDNRALHPHAALAVQMFAHHARKWIGALSATLDGLDTLVFTAGIGERSAEVRSEICSGLGYLGIKLDPERNSRHQPIISADDSPCVVRVTKTNEDLMIARHTRTLLK